MTEPLEYAGPELRRRLARCLHDVRGEESAPVWALWKQDDSVGATPLIALSSTWDDSSAQTVLEAVLDCYGLATPRVVRLRPEQESAAAVQWAAHRLGPGEDPPTDPAESAGAAAGRLSLECFLHSRTTPWSRGKRDADLATIHLVHSADNVILVADFGNGAELVATSGMRAVSDGGPRSLLLSARRGRIASRRIDGVDWPHGGGPHAIVTDEEIDILWWEAPGPLPRDGVLPAPATTGAGTLRGTQPGERLGPGTEESPPEKERR